MLAGKEHYIDLAAGKFASTSSADLDSVFRNLAQWPSRTLVIHCHGGLNSRDEGIKRVGELGPTYLDAGAYPLFVVWQSWVSEVFSNGFVEIFDELIYQASFRRMKHFIYSRIGASQAVRSGAPGSEAERALREEWRKAEADPAYEPRIPGELRNRLFGLSERDRRNLLNELMNDQEIQAETRAIANTLAPQAPDQGRTRSGAPLAGIRSTRMRPEIQDALRKGGADKRWDPTLTIAKALVDVTVRTCSRFMHGRDHGVVPTIGEELLRELYLVEGWFSWMKFQIEDAFKPDPGMYGGTAILTGLRRLREAGHDLRVVLVGHSAGSIYCCNFIDHARTIVPEQKFDVIFLAPAVTFERFSRTLDINGAAINSMRNLSLSDTLERADRWIPKITEAYPASLLYFTSGVMECDRAGTGDVPVVGMQRFFSGDVPVDTDANRRVRDYFLAGAGRTCWSAGSILEPASGILHAEHHGGFDEDPSVRRTLQDLIRDGF
ncbi:MAG TPA: hypothetical protein VLT92_07735 [Burkholderiales bacterium]|nr:hypothetical protein [Burkholderiales bacterium]